MYLEGKGYLNIYSGHISFDVNFIFRIVHMLLNSPPQIVMNQMCSYSVGPGISSLFEPLGTLGILAEVGTITKWPPQEIDTHAQRHPKCRGKRSVVAATTETTRSPGPAISPPGRSLTWRHLLSKKTWQALGDVLMSTTLGTPELCTEWDIVSSGG